MTFGSTLPLQPNWPRTFRPAASPAALSKACLGSWPPRRDPWVAKKATFCPLGSPLMNSAILPGTLWAWTGNPQKMRSYPAGLACPRGRISFCAATAS